MMPPAGEILKAVIREWIEDAVYLLVILAIVGFMVGGFFKVVIETQGQRDYANVTEWAQAAKVVNDGN